MLCTLLQIVCNARSRMSVLNVDSSCALVSTVVVSAAVAALVCSSVDIVLASTSATAVPSAMANALRRERILSLSLVKSCTICKLDEMTATATRSDGDIRSFVHLIAPSADFWTSSGCIELVSKSRIQTRCPATSSEVSGPASASTFGFSSAAAVVAGVVVAGVAAGGGVAGAAGGGTTAFPVLLLVKPMVVLTSPFPAPAV